MADKYQSLISGRETMVEATVVSTGVAEAGDLVALDATGKLDVSVLPTGVGPAVQIILASENLSAGNFVNVYDNAGTPNVRLADSTNDRRAVGYVLSSVISGNNATVYFEGKNDQLAGLTAGQRLYLDAAGAVTSTVPSLGGGDVIHQYLGKALSATAMDVEIADEIVL
jgi:hypothetical protein